MKKLDLEFIDSEFNVDNYEGNTISDKWPSLVALSSFEHIFHNNHFHVFVIP